MIPPKMLAMITQVVQSSTVSSSGSLFLTTGQRPKEDIRDSSSSAEFPLKKNNQFIVIGNVFEVIQVVLAYEFRADPDFWQLKQI